MTELDLSNNTHSDEVTSRIRSPYLRILRLNNTPVKTLEYVSKLQNLQCLNLASTSIDGAAVKRLKQLPNLIELDVRDTPLTDEDLYYLAEIPTLLKLTLSTEKYSRASLLALKERLPACSMKFGVGKTQPLDLIRQLVNGKQFAEAERQCRQAMEVIEDIQGKDAQPLSAYGYWAAVSCLNQGNSNQGKSYCKRAIEIAEKTRFKIYLPDSYLLLVQTYDEAGQQKIANTYVERAFDALKARDGYTVTGAELALRLSESYTSSSNSEKSEDWLNICDMYVKNLKSKNIKFANRDYTFVLAPLHLHLSELCYGKKQFEQSKEHALIALRYLKEHTTERPSVNQKQSKHHEELLSFAETRFAAIAAHEKRFSDALSHQRKAIEYLNSINEPTEQALLYLRSLEELARTDSRKVDHD
jgi:hypothetical protein